MSGELAAYRRLIRLGRRLDREPQLLVALLGRPARRFHPGLGKLVKVPPGKWPFVDDAVWSASGCSTEYAHPCGRAAAAVREHRRRLTALGVAYAPEAAELSRRLESAADVAALVLAQSTGAAPHGSASETLGTLERLAADSEERVAVGDVLLTHPLSCLFQPELDQAVLLVDEVDTEAGLVRGLVLNKPDGATVAEALTSWPPGERERAEAAGLSPLLAAPLHLGGDLVPESAGFLERLRWLHTLGGRVPGAVRVAPSVWRGGDLEVAGRLIRDGEAQLGDLRPFVGFSGWSALQLELELRRGVWVRARAPDRPQLWRHLTFGQPGSGPCWRAALRASGLAALSLMPRGEAAGDASLRRWVEAHSLAQVQEMVDAHAQASG